VGYRIPYSRDTRADQIAELLRERAIEAYYPLGTELSGSALADELNASRRLVREALRMLAREGLLIPSRGGAIVRLGPRSLGVAACEFRWAVDGLAARLAAGSVDGQLGARLASCVDELRRATASGDVYAAGWADIVFHLSILEASANQLLIGQRAIVASTLRGVGLAYLKSADAIAEEHEAILAAVAARNADEAEAAARAHARSDISRLLADTAAVTSCAESRSR
jgi:DNA-binding GntR family transcriptional regulator